MDYEYEDEEPYGRVLWGRLALLGVALVLVFFVGRCTAGDGDGSEVAELESEIAAYQEEIAQLEDELQAAEAGGAEEERLPSVEDEDDEEDEAEEEEEPDDEGEDDDVRTHEVVEGETLHGIADEYYGDPREASRIIEANNLTADDTLTVGQVLEIPPAD